MSAVNARPIGRILLLGLLPIGDTMFTTPTIRALRERYPPARITALAHASAAPVLHCVPEVDEVVVLPFGRDWAGCGPLMRTLRSLRAQRFDVAITFTTPAYKWVSFVCRVPLRTYMKFEPLWWLVPRDRTRWRSTHATRHYYDCACELDLPPWEAVSHRPYLVLPDAERRAAHLFLHRHGAPKEQGPLVALHAGGAGVSGLKRWPPDRFAELAERLQRAWGARILLLGGREETALARAIAAAMHDAEPIIAVGAVSLLTSFALIESCDLFIGNDSSLLHAAAALGTPYVGIVGPTSPANFHPVGRHPGQGTLVRPSPPCRRPQYFVGGALPWRRPCCQGTCRALAALRADAVLAAAAVLLQRRCAHATPACRAEAGALDKESAIGG
jgi:lipopolysaccharide heptosyltransferase II